MPAVWFGLGLVLFITVNIEDPVDKSGKLYEYYNVILILLFGFQEGAVIHRGVCYGCPICNGWWEAWTQALPSGRKPRLYYYDSKYYQHLHTKNKIAAESCGIRGRIERMTRRCVHSYSARIAS